ncbi:MAG: polyprenol monophosphomannose synthase [Microthrixaceae bacterium]
MSKVLVVPTYQEAANIETLLRSVRSVDPDLQILVVDDNSPDRTGELAEKVGADLGGVEVLHRSGKAGLGAAYRHGFRHALDAGHSVIAQMDADLSHDPAVLPELLGAVEDGYDVAVGSRYVPGGSVPNWTWLRRTLSHWGNSYARRMLRLAMNDATTAFRAYTSEVLEAIDIDGTTANGYLFQIETAFRLSGAGARVRRSPSPSWTVSQGFEDGGRPHDGGDRAEGDVVGPVAACAVAHRPLQGHRGGRVPAIPCEAQRSARAARSCGRINRRWLRNQPAPRQPRSGVGRSNQTGGGELGYERSWTVSGPSRYWRFSCSTPGSPGRRASSSGCRPSSPSRGSSSPPC